MSQSDGQPHILIFVDKGMTSVDHMKEHLAAFCLSYKDLELLWDSMLRGRTIHLIGDIEIKFHLFLMSWLDTSCGVENWWVNFLCVVGSMQNNIDHIWRGWWSEWCSLLRTWLGDIAAKIGQNDPAHGAQLNKYGVGRCKFSYHRDLIGGWWKHSREFVLAAACEWWATSI